MRTFTIATLIVVAWSPTQLLAQAVSNAAIHGVVSDPTGALIPLGQIKATQTDTGQVLSTVTGADGSYVLPNLPVGPYSVEATAQGFNGYLQSGLVLQVGTNVQVNIKLQLGAVTQELRVSANAAMVETEDTSISQVVDKCRLAALPLNG